MLPRFLLILILAVSASAQVPLGATKQEVIDALGWPKSVSGAKDREILNYPDYSVLLVDGKVDKLEFKSKAGKSPATYAPPPKPAQPRTPEELLGPTPGRVDTRPALSSEPVQPMPVALPPSNIKPAPSDQLLVHDHPDPFAPARRTLAWMGFIFGALLGLKLCIRHALRRMKREDELYSKPSRPPRPTRPAEVPSGIWPQRAIEPMPRRINWSLALLKEIEWHRFEHVVAAYERELGNDADLTDFGPDGGIDIRVFENDSRTPKRIIQCKAFDNKPVDVKLVRELLGVMAHEKVPKGAFYTTSTFTPPALEFARDHLELDLVDGPTFLNRLERLTQEAQQRLIEVATEGDYTTPTCPSCGRKMVRRTARKGRNAGNDFWACATSRCGHILNIASAD